MNYQLLRDVSQAFYMLFSALASAESCEHLDEQQPEENKISDVRGENVYTE